MSNDINPKLFAAIHDRPTYVPQMYQSNKPKHTNMWTALLMYRNILLFL